MTAFGPSSILQVNRLRNSMSLVRKFFPLALALVLLGGGFQTLPLLIYQQFNTTRDFGMASAMSSLLLVVALTCLFLQLRLVRRRGA